MDSIYKELIIPTICLLTISPFSLAGTITLDATNSGWYYDDGSHVGYTEPNISTGVCTACLYSGESRSFFLFDLSTVSAPVVSATLRISTGDTDGSFGRLVTDDSFETYSLFDVSSDPSILPVGDTGNTSLFDDLADGDLYGNYNLSSPLDLYINIDLSAAAINDINNADALFGIGGAITTLDNDLSRTQYAFGGTHLGGQTRELILTTVPVTPAIWLFGSGLIGLIGLARRKTRN